MSLLVRNLSPRASAHHCVWCRDALLQQEVVCGGCNAGYHADCASEASYCGVAGCLNDLAPHRLDRRPFVPAGRTAPTEWPIRVVDEDRPQELSPWWLAWLIATAMTLPIPFLTYPAVQPLFEVSKVTGHILDDLKPLALITLSLLPFLMACLIGLWRVESEPEVGAEATGTALDDWREWISE